MGDVDEHIQILRNQVVIMGLLTQLATQKHPEHTLGTNTRGALMRMNMEKRATIKKLESYRCSKGLL